MNAFELYHKTTKKEMRTLTPFFAYSKHLQVLDSSIGSHSVLKRAIYYSDQKYHLKNHYTVTGQKM